METNMTETVKRIKPIVQSLLDEGANPNIKNRDGDTPFDRAVEAGSIECANVLSY